MFDVGVNVKRNQNVQHSSEDVFAKNKEDIVPSLFWNATITALFAFKLLLRSLSSIRIVRIFAQESVRIAELTLLTDKTVSTKWKHSATFPPVTFRVFWEYSDFSWNHHQRPTQNSFADMDTYIPGMNGFMAEKLFLNIQGRLWGVLRRKGFLKYQSAFCKIAAKESSHS